MAETGLLPPNDVARTLGISPSTLRRWSAEFSELLSDTAGRPEPSPQGEPAHRRYTDADITLLGQVGDLLRRGLTYRQVADHLRDDPASAVESDGSAPESVESKSVIVQPSRVVTPAFNIITDALQSVVDNQQNVLSSQQANRDLLGVVIQDNFNLKEENSRLRERMIHLERELSEVRRRSDETRVQLLERVQAVEASSKPRRGCLAALLGLQ